MWSKFLVAALGAAVVVAGSVPSPFGVGGSSVPSPLVFHVPSPVMAHVPSPAVGIPTPSPAPGTVGGSSPAPPPGDLYSYYSFASEIMPAPDTVPAPAPHNPSPLPPEIVITTQQSNSPSPFTPTTPKKSEYFFCETAILCYDCNGKTLTSNQQRYVAQKWNDTNCDDASSTYNLNCARFNFDSGACMTTTTTTLRVTRQIFKQQQQVTDDPAGTDNTETGMSPASMTAIIVCLAVAVVGGVTVVVFYVIKKKKEREYADYQA